MIVGRVSDCSGGVPGAFRGSADSSDRQGGQPRDRVDLVRQLLEMYLPQVYRFALQLSGNEHDAADIAQATMLRAWRKRHKLREPKAAKVWLFKIAANLYRDQQRRAQHRAHPRETLTAEPASSNPTVERALSQSEAVQQVLQQMQLLPPRQQQVLHLHAFEQCTHNEIAGILGISIPAVKSNLSHARRALRQSLSEFDPKPKVNR